MNETTDEDRQTWRGIAATKKSHRRDAEFAEGSLANDK